MALERDLPDQIRVCLSKLGVNLTPAPERYLEDHGLSPKARAKVKKSFL